MTKTKLTLPVLMALTVAGCATQPPAPVEQSYWNAKNTDTRSALRSTPNVVEEYEEKTTTVETYQPQGKQALYHVVQEGDTVWRIAQKYDTDVATINELNNIGSRPIYKGQRIKVAEATDAAVSGDYSLTRTTTTTTKKVAVSEASAEALAAVEPEVNYELYRVRKGENLFRIGLNYHVSPLDIMAANDMSKPEDLQAGSVIKVPVVSKEATPTGTAIERTINEKLARQEGFIWPTRGVVTSKFGRQGDGVVNNGIKIRVKESTPIYAAEDGTVIYADSSLKTYGNLILLRHNNGVITAYAHNSQNMAKRGEKVQKGEVIALAGMTGNATEPQLHFEVRRNARAIDPQKVLPKL